MEKTVNAPVKVDTLNSVILIEFLVLVSAKIIMFVGGIIWILMKGIGGGTDLGEFSATNEVLFEIWLLLFFFGSLIYISNELKKGNKFALTGLVIWSVVSFYYWQNIWPLAILTMIPKFYFIWKCSETPFFSESKKREKK